MRKCCANKKRYVHLKPKKPYKKRKKRQCYDVEILFLFLFQNENNIKICANLGKLRNSGFPYVSNGMIAAI